MYHKSMHVLGIDAGGTKTVCLLAGEGGHVIAEARDGGANLQSSGELEVEKVLHRVGAMLGQLLVPARVPRGVGVSLDPEHMDPGALVDRSRQLLELAEEAGVDVLPIGVEEDRVRQVDELAADLHIRLRGIDLDRGWRW